MATGWLIYQSSMIALEQLTTSRLFQPSSIKGICMRQNDKHCPLTPHMFFLRYLMVDVVVNNVMATSNTPDYSKYFFKDAVRGTFLSLPS